MKTLKIGQINFYKNDNVGDTGAYRVYGLCNDLNKISNIYNYTFVDCINEECDIVFYSLYDDIKNLKLCKGHPLFIYWTDEYGCPGGNEIFDDPFSFYKANNLSISFYDDSDTNCFYPYGMIFYNQYLENKKLFNYTPVSQRNMFCTFCASNEFVYNAQFRTDTVKYISKNYKTITCCGRVLNNTNNEYLPWGSVEKLDYHKFYKFNLCFENEYTSGNIIYFTEKLMNAFSYNVIPIYWGAERITEIINSNAFINCNGLSREKMLEKIIEVDTNDELFDYMIHQPIFSNNHIDYETYFIKKIDKFIVNHTL